MDGNGIQINRISACSNFDGFQPACSFKRMILIQTFIFFSFFVLCIVHLLDGCGFPCICLFSLLVTCNEALHGTESIFVFLG
jgi:hypothetical protein